MWMPEDSLATEGQFSNVNNHWKQNLTHLLLRIVCHLGGDCHEKQAYFSLQSYVASDLAACLEERTTETPNFSVSLAQVMVYAFRLHSADHYKAPRFLGSSVP